MICHFSTMTALWKQGINRSLYDTFWAKIITTYHIRNVRDVMLTYFSHWLHCKLSFFRQLITMTSKWALWRVKSPASRVFVQPFVQAQIKALRRWPLWELPVDSSHKGPVTLKLFPFDDVIIFRCNHRRKFSSIRRYFCFNVCQCFTFTKELELVYLTTYIWSKRSCFYQFIYPVHIIHNSEWSKPFNIVIEGTLKHWC